MEKTIKNCYFEIFNTVPSEHIIEEIKNTMPKCISFIANVISKDSCEVKDLLHLFIHSKYKKR